MHFLNISISILLLRCLHASLRNMALLKLLTSCNFAIMDIESIQTTKEHKCIRKIYVLVKDGSTDITREFIPCQPFYRLEEKYRKSFLYCKKHIHKLSYEPNYQSKGIQPCHRAEGAIKKFLCDNNIQAVVYKGGSVERDFCAVLDIPSYNLEQLGVGKAFSHDPEQEVHFFFDELIRLGVLSS